MTGKSSRKWSVGWIPRNATYGFANDYIDNSRHKEQECRTVKGEFALDYDAEAGEVSFRRTYSYKVVGEGGEKVALERGHVWSPKTNVFAEKCGSR